MVRKSPGWKRVLRWALWAVLAYYGLLITALILLRWIDPPTTAVQIERHADRKRYSFVPLREISPHLQHAVVAAEDARFFHHHGFDWKEIGNAVEQDLGDGRKRGASTITQQLVRNLFLSTGRSVFRKGVEFSIVPLAEGILSKQRILELYLNVIEWAGRLWGRSGLAILLPASGEPDRTRAGGGARRNTARAVASKARPSDAVRRADSGTHAPDGVLTGSHTRSSARKR